MTKIILATLFVLLIAAAAGAKGFERDYDYDGGYSGPAKAQKDYTPGELCWVRGNKPENCTPPAKEAAKKMDKSKEKKK